MSDFGSISDKEIDDVIEILKPKNPKKLKDVMKLARHFLGKSIPELSPEDIANFHLASQSILAQDENNE